jgi:hypothetical protein
MTRTCDACGHTGEDVQPGYWSYCDDDDACRDRMPLSVRRAIEAQCWLDAHEDEYREGARNVAFALGLAALMASERGLLRDVKPSFSYEGVEVTLRAAGLWRE